MFGFGVTVALIVGVVYARKRLRDRPSAPASRPGSSAQGESPLLRPLAAGCARCTGASSARWWMLVVPRGALLLAAGSPRAGSGIEFTTASAIAGVGRYVFVVYGGLVADHPGPPRSIADLLTWADDTRMDWLVRRGQGDHRARLAARRRAVRR